MANTTNCINTYRRLGIPVSIAKRMCAKDTSAKGGKSAPTKAKPINHPRTKNEFGLVPLGRMVRRSSNRVPMIEFYWGGAAGKLGVGAIVMPNTKNRMQAYKKGLGRRLVPSDREGWMEYARRIGLPDKAAASAWKLMISSSGGKRKVTESVASILETTSWWGYSIPHLFQISMKHGGLAADPPKMAKTPKSSKKDVEPVNTKMPSPSFPFHTGSARKVYAKALKLIKLYPLENPAEIVKRAIAATNTKLINDLTPEDEKLLRMAVELAQNGPPKNISRIAGMPGGPARSGRPGHMRGPGAP